MKVDTKRVRYNQVDITLKDSEIVSILYALTTFMNVWKGDHCATTSHVGELIEELEKLYESD